MNRKSFLTIMVISLMVFGFTTVFETNAQTTAKIGLLAPKTGALGVLGESFENGAKLAIKDLNAMSSGYTFEIVVQDTKTSADGAREAMNALVSAGVSGVVGAAASSSTLAAMEAAKANKIPLISYASTSPAITTADDDGYLFRVVPSDAFQGKAAADLADYLDLHNVAIIGIDDPYGQGLTGAFEDAFLQKNSSNKVATTRAYNQETETDFASHVSAIKDANPDGVFMVSFVDDGASIINELYDQGVNVPVIGTDGIATAGMFEKPGANDSFIGVLGTAPKVTGTADFVSAYNAEYGEDPGIFVAEAYDATMLIGKAIIEAGSTSGEAVKNALPTVGNNYQGVSGTITFDSNGDILGGTYDIWQAQKNADGDGEIVVIGTWDSNGLKLDSSKTIVSRATKAASPINLLPFIFAMVLLIPLRKKYKKN